MDKSYCLIGLLTFLAQPQICIQKSSSCDQLLMGQYICDTPKIEETSQQIENCQLIEFPEPMYLAEVICYPAPGIECNGMVSNGTNLHFVKRIPCEKKSDKSFKTALLLSIFLGMFGVDRFYLGYPALGLLKLSTFGFLLVGQLIDIILIAAQVVKPADGGEYIIDYYGPKMTQDFYHSLYHTP